MSKNRLEILQMLADGKIDAEQAASMMNGAPQPEVVEETAEELVEDSAETTPPVEEKQPEEVVEIEVDEEPIVVAKVKAGESAKSQRQSNLRIVISGNPVKANLDIAVPLSLLEFGQQIGAMFTPDINGASWNDINFEVDAGEQHIHIYTEAAQ